MLAQCKIKDGRTILTHLNVTKLSVYQTVEGTVNINTQLKLK